MKNVLIITLALFCVNTKVFAQFPIVDYSQYNFIFGDDFKYANPSTPTTPASDFQTNSSVVALSGSGSPDVVGHPISDNWLFVNPDWRSLNTVYTSTMVTMPSVGVIRLNASPIGSSRVRYEDSRTIPASDTDDGGTIWPLDYWGGYINSKRDFYFGLIEARIKLSSQNGYYCAFWTKLGNELDILDVSRPNQIINRNINWFEGTYSKSITFNPQATALPDGTILPDLSADFHDYSCKWDPEGATFFIDGHYVGFVSNSEVRNIPNHPWWVGSLELCVQLTTAAGSALSYIDIDWVKVWKKKCNNDDVNINCIGSLCTADAFVYPFILPGLFKHKTFSLNVPNTSLFPIVSVPSGTSAILEGEAVEIKADFFVDQSIRTTRLTTVDGTSTGAPITVLDNGYFIIEAINCDYDEGLYMPAVSFHDEISNSTSNLNTAIMQDSQRQNDSIRQNVYATIEDINAVGEIRDFSVYPNPTQTNITISFPCKSCGLMEICIKDVAGRTRYTEHVKCNGGSSTQQLINMGIFSAGVYFVNLTLNDQHVVKKVVKL